ncbi:MAG: hypothetical protein ACLQI7_21685 [Streptosporangiaceae bacterium]
MAALRAAVSAVRLGEHRVAVAVGSELVSRSLARGPAQDPGHSRYQLPALDPVGRRRGRRGGIRAEARWPEPAGGLDAPGLARTSTRCA